MSEVDVLIAYEEWETSALHDVRDVWGQEEDEDLPAGVVLGRALDGAALAAGQVPGAAGHEEEQGAVLGNLSSKKKSEHVMSRRNVWYFLEPQNPPIGWFYVDQKRRFTGCEAQNAFAQCSVGVWCV